MELPRLSPKSLSPKLKFLLGLSTLLLLGWFSPEIADTDFWWHLKTGQYIVETHHLPVPDPFAFTTAAAPPAYPGEEHTRNFNLTHEWLAQVLFYLVYHTGGFPGIVLFRAILLTAFCALVGLISYRRCGGFYRALAAAFATAGVVSAFAADRPFVITFLLLAATITILERGGKLLWLLPPLLLFWANCHGGFFLGWVALGAYSAEALYLRWRGKPAPHERTLWIVAALSIAISGLNPSGYRILQILTFYRQSYLTSRLLEWAPTPLWPPHWYTLLLLGAIATLLFARRRVRPVDWLLFIAFTVAALSATRNVVLLGLIAPILIATYLPPSKRAIPAFAPLAPAALMLIAIGAGIARGSFFQFKASDWKWPAGAADFLLTHHITQPLFNTYEYGGYLIWRLSPEERVFIDGRSLSESLFLDYARILYNHDSTGGKSAQQLLDQYGVQAIVMNSFEYVSGNVYTLAPALADPQQTEWKLVYSDPTAMVFMRNPPPGVQPLNSLAVLDHLESECDLHLQHEPQYPRCARALGQVFSKVGDFTRARRWIGTYLSLPHDPDPEAEQAYQRMLGAGR